MQAAASWRNSRGWEDHSQRARPSADSMARLSVWWKTYPFRSAGGCPEWSISKTVSFMPPVARTTGAVPYRIPIRGGQPAGFEQAGHDQQVGAGVDEMSQLLAV